MSPFKTNNIQLVEEEDQPSQIPTFKRSSSSNWSIPCCSPTLFIGRKANRIRLSEDSDNEQLLDSEEEEEHNNFEQEFSNFQHSLNNNVGFLQHATTVTKLSHNPFARTEDTQESYVAKNQTPEVVGELDIAYIPQAEEDVEELVNFSHPAITASDTGTSTAVDKFSKYENEPDWIDMHKENEEVQELDSVTGFNVTRDTSPDIELPTSSSSSLKQKMEEEAAIVTQEKQDEKIPQIEQETLKLLPLPQLSNELPPTMIHNFKSMYDEQPTMSTSTPPRRTGKRTTSTSRFSMSEQDFLKMRKEEERKIKERNQLASSKRTSHTVIIATDKHEERQELSSLAKDMTVEGLLKELDMKDAIASVKEATVPTKETNSSDNIEPSTANIFTATSLDTNQKKSPPVVIHEKKEIMDPSTMHDKKRRSSIVTTAAQSILGDKFDDITEKLAFIKKSIIMNIDSDDELEEEEADNAQETLRKIAILKEQEEKQKRKIIKKQTSAIELKSSSADSKGSIAHKRANSLMDVAPTLARFMNQLGNAATGSEEKATSNNREHGKRRGSSPSTTTNNSVNGSKKEKELEEREEEELFDFTKVIEAGKTFRNFSEGFVGNGIRMINDVAAKVKTSIEMQQQEEFLRFQQEQMNNKQQQKTTNGNADNLHEDEWMHGYL